MVDLHFIVAGFNKCGTTTLCTLLNEHPGLYLPARYEREPGHFVKPDFEGRWSEYESYFAAAPPGAFLGEGSTAYSTAAKGDLAQERIVVAYPDVRVIFIARDPIRRIESAFRELHDSGARWGLQCPFALEDALREVPSLIEDSRYSVRSRPYFEALPAGNVLILFLEDLQLAPQATLARCFSFLDVDDGFEVPDASRRQNAGEAKFRDTPRLRELRNGIWSPETGDALNSLSIRVQRQLLPALGLMEPIPKDAVDWSEAALRLVREQLTDDAEEFLRREGRSVEMWPRLFAAGEA